MTIKTTDLLDLLAYAGELDLSIFVKKDKDGDYVVKFYELYTNNFAETLVIHSGGEVDGYRYSSGTCSFDYMMDTFVDMLSNKKEEKLKAQKRQELLARLTNEEKELLFKELVKKEETKIIVKVLKDIFDKDKKVT